MKTFSMLALAATMCLAWTSQAPAAETKNQVWKSTDLIGKTVKNTANENLGNVEDVVVDTKSGKVVYVVVAYGEVLGFGGKMFAVDPRAFYMSQDNSCAIMETSKADLEKAQGFDANKWPTQADPQWSGKRGAKGEGAKDTRVADTGSSNKDQELRRLTGLTGMAVRSPDNQDLGRIRGFAVNLQEAKVVYSTLAFGGVAGVGTKYFAVPWNAMECKTLDLKEGNKVLVLNTTKAELDKKSGFDWNAWPNEADNGFKTK